MNRAQGVVLITEVFLNELSKESRKTVREYVIDLMHAMDDSDLATYLRQFGHKIQGGTVEKSINGVDDSLLLKIMKDLGKMVRTTRRTQRLDKMHVSKNIRNLLTPSLA